jgi:hypothetical protein
MNDSVTALCLPDLELETNPMGIPIFDLNNFVDGGLNGAPSLLGVYTNNKP